MVTTAEAGTKLRAFLKKRTGATAKAVAALLDHSKVRVAGKVERFGSVGLKAGQKIQCDVHDARGSLQEERVRSSFETPQVVAESEGFWVFAKTPGLPSQRTRDPRRPSVEGLVHDWAKARGALRPVLCHRLDRDTSGLLVFAKGEEMANLCMDWFKHKRISKTYLALAHGRPKEKKGQWLNHLGPVGKTGGRARHGVVKSGGQRADTAFEVLAQGQGLSLWRLHPGTGRTHQLRVQLSHQGHPIVGDDLYGSRREVEHHLLHAWKLRLPEAAGLPEELVQPPPPRFVEVAQKAGLSLPTC